MVWWEAGIVVEAYLVRSNSGGRQAGQHALHKIRVGGSTMAAVVGTVSRHAACIAGRAAVSRRWSRQADRQDVDEIAGH